MNDQRETEIRAALDQHWAASDANDDARSRPLSLVACWLGELSPATDLAARLPVIQ
jgi:hypothetical protein